MDDFESYYDVLEVKKTATQDEIKKAFHVLAREYHPDKNTRATEKVKQLGEKKFREVNEAYSVLKDPSKRRQYDAKIKEFEDAKNPASASSQSDQKTATPRSSPKAAKKINKKRIFWGIVGLLIFIGIVSNLGNSTSTDSEAMTATSTYVLTGSGQYQLPNGTFSLYFPSKPTFGTNTQFLLPNNQDFVTDEVYTLVSPDNNAGLKGIYIPSAFNGSTDTPEQNLKNEISYTANNNGNTLNSSTATTYDGFPAINYTGTSGGLYFVGRDVLKVIKIA